MTSIRILLVVSAAAVSIAVADDPPPFGTILQTWELQLSGGYSGAGITWCRDNGRLYLLDQRGVSGTTACYSCLPANPDSSLRNEGWTFPNLGDTTADIPWGICWDPDTGCFWMSTILDGDIYAGYWLLRLTSAGAWTGDSWRIDSQPLLWIAGMEKWTDLGFFCGAGVADPGQRGIVKFDPYTKTLLGFLPTTMTPRACALVPADSYYIITGNWEPRLVELDSSGQVLRDSSPPGLAVADATLLIPDSPAPTDTVTFFAINGDANNTLSRVSAGLLWAQLETGQAIAEPARPTARPAAFSTEPNPCRGFAILSFTGPLDHSTTGPLSVSLFDASGRRVLKSPFANRQSPFALDLRSMPVGVYLVRAETDAGTASTRLVIAR